MNPDCDALNRRISEAWLVAALELEITVVAPYPALGAVAAFLPEFGSSQGMILAPDSGVDPLKILIEFARDQNMFLSILDPKLYGHYDRVRFIEALDDWGYFGPIEKLPSWMLR